MAYFPFLLHQQGTLFEENPSKTTQNCCCFFAKFFLFLFFACHLNSFFNNFYNRWWLCYYLLLVHYIYFDANLSKKFKNALSLDAFHHQIIYTCFSITHNNNIRERDGHGEKFNHHISFVLREEMFQFLWYAQLLLNNYKKKIQKYNRVYNLKKYNRVRHEKTPLSRKNAPTKFRNFVIIKKQKISLNKIFKTKTISMVIAFLYHFWLWKDLP